VWRYSRSNDQSSAWAKTEQPEIAFTFDDPKTDVCGGLPWQEINTRMLAALSKYHTKTVLFVTGKRVDSEAGRSLVAAWDRSGHAVGNHSYSHLFFNDADIKLANFESDVLKNEPLIHGYTHFTRLFRFPYFKEGETAENLPGEANQFPGGSLHPLKSSAFSRRTVTPTTRLRIRQSREGFYHRTQS
jgi:peptidoglycan/xylan/chitin deacetylase (PgdA/CDA1 family)